MIRVLFSPIEGLNNEIEYHFDGDTITVICDGEEEIYDFTGTPDGELDYLSLEHDLPIRLITRVGREDGVLWVELVNPIPDDATDFQRYPEWIEVETDGEI